MVHWSFSLHLQAVTLDLLALQYMHHTVLAGRGLSCICCFQDQAIDYKLDCLIGEMRTLSAGV